MLHLRTIPHYTEVIDMTRNAIRGVRPDVSHLSDNDFLSYLTLKGIVPDEDRRSLYQAFCIFQDRASMDFFIEKYL